MAVSEEGKNMLGVPVPEGMVGIAVSGGGPHFVQLKNSDMTLT